MGRGARDQLTATLTSPAGSRERAFGGSQRASAGRDREAASPGRVYMGLSRRQTWDKPLPAADLDAFATMMKDNNRNVQDILVATAPQHESKLHGVFHKLTDMWQPQKQKMTATEALEPALPDQRFTPEGGAAQGGWRALARRLERELRAAKSAHRLSAAEVLLPSDLLPRVAREALHLADPEPCGLRGCTLYVTLEAGDSCQRIGMVKLDPATVSTFELYLVLRQDSSSWQALLPQFLKNLTRGNTLVISPRFSLEKKKLYRSYLE